MERYLLCPATRYLPRAVGMAATNGAAHPDCKKIPDIRFLLRFPIETSKSKFSSQDGTSQINDSSGHNLR